MSSTLVRGTTLGGAIVLGLGSILGTGAYVSVGLSASIAGEYIVLAILMAAFTALMNGLSSAQLAAVHPVSGGTYEYGYRFLNPSSGRLAGILFVIAKSASAATAALAVAWYLVDWLGQAEWLVKPLAAALLLVFTWFVLAGVKRTNWLNLVLVSISVLGLLVFAGLSFSLPGVGEPPAAESRESISLFYAAALMFVAFTGYGRIATMGEEVVDPRHTIPRAIVLTLIITSALYVLVGLAILNSDQTLAFAERNFNIANLVSGSSLQWVVVAGGIVAMCGVILNLVLGVSRVVLAMGRRGDLPVRLSLLNTTQTSAPAATWLTFVVMALIVTFGGIQSAWSISAFTVLCYYGLTNAAALKVSASERFVPKVVSVLGLISCLALIVFIPIQVTLVGIALVAAIVLISEFMRRYKAN
ncbi:APC family permease [Aliidiomarina sp. Khilg15.8]